MPIAALPHRALLLIEGEDAEHFLEGLVTSSLPGVGEVTGSALLTPQGKLLFSFLLSRTDVGFALECDASERDALAKRLTLYKLRAKVTLTPSDTSVTTHPTDGLTDLRHADMPRRAYGATSEGDAATYHAYRAEAGVLEGPDEIIANQDFPHDVALDLTGAVSFTKGCFVGQEVVSRVKHRGTARRRPVLVQAKGLTPGQTIKVDDREVGDVRMHEGDQGIAVVRIDKLKGQAKINGNPVALSPPPYATYKLDEA